MIVVLGSVVTSPDKTDEALIISRKHVARSRLETGCLEHGVYRDTENPDRLVFVERWLNSEALRAHFQVPESKQFAQALTALCAEPPTIMVYFATDLSAGEKGGN